jgi:hypothetical protein
VEQKRRNLVNVRNLRGQSKMSDGFDNAAGMIGTGIGLSIMTMGAMVPLIILKKVSDEGVSVGKSSKTGKNFKIDIPKINVNFKTPNIAVKKIKIK